MSKSNGALGRVEAAKSSSSPPVNIPDSPQDADDPLNRYEARSAPTTRLHVPLSSPSLLDPVLEDSEVLVSSSLTSGYMSSSAKRRREAEMGDLSSDPRSRRYGTMGFREHMHGGGSIRVPHEFEQSAEVAEDYVKIASRNKRAEHATSYVYL